MNGTDLYALVERYHGFGIHRAGTDGDRATVEWYGNELEQRGLVVEHQPVTFDRYVADSVLMADGEAIDHLPLPYEWTGSIDTTDIDVVLADAHAGGRDDDLDDALSRSGDALVIATTHPEGSLVALNRDPEDRGGHPTVLVAGRDHARLAAASTRHLRLDARIESAATTNLFAHRPGVDPADAMLLTTPLTGWFGCAGERGTGAAVLLDLVERLTERPIVVLATGAHELEYLGVARWVEATSFRPRAIVHVGASVAVDAPDENGRRRLVPTRLAMTDQSGADADAIARALEPASFQFRPDTSAWLGESEVFCALGVPMISFTGSGVDFHTPEDTPERATSPDSLATVAAAIADAAEALWIATA